MTALSSQYVSMTKLSDVPDSKPLNYDLKLGEIGG